MTTAKRAALFAFLPILMSISLAYPALSLYAKEHDARREENKHEAEDRKEQLEITLELWRARFLEALERRDTKKEERQAKEESEQETPETAPASTTKTSATSTPATSTPATTTPTTTAPSAPAGTAKPQPPADPQSATPQAQSPSLDLRGQAADPSALYTYPRLPPALALGLLAGACALSLLGITLLTIPPSHPRLIAGTRSVRTS